MTGIPDESGSVQETADVRSERLALERSMLDEARDEISAGRGISDDDIDAWLDGFVAGEPVGTPENFLPRRMP